MHIEMEPNTSCWQARFKNVWMGCCLDLDELAEKVDAIRTLTQVHGSIVLGDNRYSDAAEADGLVSDQTNIALVVRTADCVPVHVTDGRRIAVIHAGWRGTEAGIVKELPHYFRMEHAWAAIGPAISTANYEVDTNLYGSWLKREPALEQWLHPQPKGGLKRQFNLKGFVRQQLIDMGIPESHVSLIPVCTYASTLPSYRRERENAKRIFNYVYRLPDPDRILGSE